MFHAIIFKDADFDWPTITVITIEKMREVIKSVEQETAMTWDKALFTGEVDIDDAQVLTLVQQVDLETQMLKVGNEAREAKADMYDFEESKCFIGPDEASVALHLMRFLTVKELK